MKKILIVVLVTLLVAAGGLYFRLTSVHAAAAATSNVPTATVQRGTLAATVNSAGNITAAQQVALNFQQSGVVQQVNVQVGDQVKAGQVLATLNTSDLQLQLKNAQVNFKVAEDKLAQTKNPSTEQDIANARAQLDAAKAAYNKLTAGASSSSIAAAKANVASAQAAYTAAVNAAGTSSDSLTSAAAAMEKARVAVQAAQSAYDRVANSPSVGMSSQATTLQQATIDYQSAQASYQSLQATSQSDANSKVQSAKAGLDQAKASLAALQDQVNPNDVVSAQAQVTQAQNNLDKLLSGPDAATLDIAQNAVDQANIAVQQAQLALDNAQIVAPFDGAVTAVNITPGQQASSATSGAIQLADLSHLQVVVNMAEVDVNKLKVGQDVQVTLDAVPNRTFQGKVSLVAPAGVLTQGVVNYPVTVSLTDASAAVKTGMTANLNVIIAQHENVLMVPNRAVKTVTTAASGQARSATPANGSGAGGPAQNSAGPAANAGGAGGTAQNSAGPASSRAAGAGSAGQGSTGNSSGSGANGSAARPGGGASAAASGFGSGQRPARQQSVTVLRDGQQAQVQVQTGLSNDSMTEIISGLNEGDVVVLNVATTTTTRTGGGPGFGLPGVGRIGG